MSVSAKRLSDLVPNFTAERLKMTCRGLPGEAPNVHDSYGNHGRCRDWRIFRLASSSSVLGEDELHREVMMAATLNHWVTGDVGGRAGLFFSQSVAT